MVASSVFPNHAGCDQLFDAADELFLSLASLVSSLKEQCEEEAKMSSILNHVNASASSECQLRLM